MYISIDIGGTNIRIAGSNSLENPKFEFLQKIKSLDDYNADLANITNKLKEVKNIKGVSLGIPGRLDAEKNKAWIPNLKTWSEKNIKDGFEKSLRAPTYLENDTSLAALGEATYGAVKNKDFIFFIWGTGFGGSKIKNQNGDIRYFPFEPGHDYIIDKNGREGLCGHRGDLESYVGGDSVENYYKKQAHDLSEDEWNDVLSYFCKGIKLILNDTPSDLLIFGGGISFGQKDKLKRVEKELKTENQNIQILISKLGDDAGLYGGFALLKTQKSHN